MDNKSKVTGEGSSPTISRFGRALKPKVSTDFCDIDKAFRLSKATKPSSSPHVIKIPTLQLKAMTKLDPSSSAVTNFGINRMTVPRQVRIPRPNTQAMTSMDFEEKIQETKLLKVFAPRPEQQEAAKLDGVKICKKKVNDLNKKLRESMCLQPVKNPRATTLSKSSRGAYIQNLRVIKKHPNVHARNLKDEVIELEDEEFNHGTPSTPAPKNKVIIQSNNLITPARKTPVVRILEDIVVKTPRTVVPAPAPQEEEEEEIVSVGYLNSEHFLVDESGNVIEEMIYDPAQTAAHGLNLDSDSMCSTLSADGIDYSTGNIVSYPVDFIGEETVVSCESEETVFTTTMDEQVLCADGDDSQVLILINKEEDLNVINETEGVSISKDDSNYQDAYNLQINQQEGDEMIVLDPDQLGESYIILQDLDENILNPELQGVEEGTQYILRCTTSDGVQEILIDNETQLVQNDVNEEVVLSTLGAEQILATQETEFSEGVSTAQTSTNITAKRNEENAEGVSNSTKSVRYFKSPERKGRLIQEAGSAERKGRLIEEARSAERKRINTPERRGRKADVTKSSERKGKLEEIKSPERKGGRLKEVKSPERKGHFKQSEKQELVTSIRRRERRMESPESATTRKSSGRGDDRKTKDEVLLSPKTYGKKPTPRNMKLREDAKANSIEDFLQTFEREAIEEESLATVQIASSLSGKTTEEFLEVLEQEINDATSETFTISSSEVDEIISISSTSTSKSPRKPATSDKSAESPVYRKRKNAEDLLTKIREMEESIEADLTEKKLLSSSESSLITEEVTPRNTQHDSPRAIKKEEIVRDNSAGRKASPEKHKKEERKTSPEKHNREDSHVKRRSSPDKYKRDDSSHHHDNLKSPPGKHTKEDTPKNTQKVEKTPKQSDSPARNKIEDTERKPLKTHDTPTKSRSEDSEKKPLKPHDTPVKSKSEDSEKKPLKPHDTPVKSRSEKFEKKPIKPHDTPVKNKSEDPEKKPLKPHDTPVKSRSEDSEKRPTKPHDTPVKKRSEDSENKHSKRDSSGKRSEEKSRRRTSSKTEERNDLPERKSDSSGRRTSSKSDSPEKRAEERRRDSPRRRHDSRSEKTTKFEKSREGAKSEKSILKEEAALEKRKSLRHSHVEEEKLKSAIQHKPATEETAKYEESRETVVNEMSKEAEELDAKKVDEVPRINEDFFGTYSRESSPMKKTYSRKSRRNQSTPKADNQNIKHDEMDCSLGEILDQSGIEQIAQPEVTVQQNKAEESGRLLSPERRKSKRSRSKSKTSLLSPNPEDSRKNNKTKTGVDDSVNIPKEIESSSVELEQSRSFTADNSRVEEHLDSTIEKNNTLETPPQRNVNKEIRTEDEHQGKPKGPKEVKEKRKSSRLQHAADSKSKDESIEQPKTLVAESATKVGESVVETPQVKEFFSPKNNKELQKLLDRNLGEVFTECRKTRSGRDLHHERGQAEHSERKSRTRASLKQDAEKESNEESSKNDTDKLVGEEGAVKMGEDEEEIKAVVEDKDLKSIYDQLMGNEEVSSEANSELKTETANEESSECSETFDVVSGRDEQVEQGLKMVFRRSSVKRESESLGEFINECDDDIKLEYHEVVKEEESDSGVGTNSGVKLEEENKRTTRSMGNNNRKKEEDENEIDVFELIAPDVKVEVKSESDDDSQFEKLLEEAMNAPIENAKAKKRRSTRLKQTNEPDQEEELAQPIQVVQEVAKPVKQRRGKAAAKAPNTDSSDKEEFEYYEELVARLKAKDVKKETVEDTETNDSEGDMESEEESEKVPLARLVNVKGGKRKLAEIASSDEENDWEISAALDEDGRKSATQESRSKSLPREAAKPVEEDWLFKSSPHLQIPDLSSPNSAKKLVVRLRNITDLIKPKTENEKSKKRNKPAGIKKRKVEPSPEDVGEKRRSLRVSELKPVCYKERTKTPSENTPVKVPFKKSSLKDIMDDVEIIKRALLDSSREEDDPAEPASSSCEIDQAIHKTEPAEEVTATNSHSEAVPKLEIKTEICDAFSVAVKQEVQSDEETEQPPNPMDNLMLDIKQEIKEEVLDASDIPTIRKLYDFNDGDLAYAKLGSYPYWPCMIAREPKTEIIMNFKMNKLMYHVRFFGDKGRRSWVRQENLIPLTSRHDLERHYIAAKAKHFSNKYCMQFKLNLGKLSKMWDVGLEEALTLLHKTVDQRYEFFFEMFASEKEKRLKAKEVRIKAEPVDEQPESIEASPTKAKRGKKSVSPTKSLTTTESERSKRKRKKYNDLDYESSGNTSMDEGEGLRAKRRKVKSEEVKIKEEVLDDDAPEFRPRLPQLDLSSEGSVSDTDSSSRWSVRTPIVCTNETQAALYKRNSLFKGVLREKVCQKCLKPGDIYKCRGKCFSYYHKECALMKMRVEIVDEEYDSDCQIVTIMHKRYEPPKNLSLSTDKQFREMTLSEQIDFKLKELMDPIMQKTMYDSPSDTSEDSASEKGELTVQHVTADDVVLVAKSKKKKGRLDDDFKCTKCVSGVDPECFVCGREANPKAGGAVRQKCSIPACGKFFHLECLKTWPQTQVSLHSTSAGLDSFSCPMHMCHICVSDNPRASISRLSIMKIVRCLKCPATYHSNTCCIPAGTEILSNTQIICPRHFTVKSGKHDIINTKWCFICSEGGDLICCETCPTSVHADCSQLELQADDKFICEECETGRLPLYDEIVWVKLGKYRWWPALIIFPNEVPENVRNMPHQHGDFVVKFFGTHDHYWVNRGRVFLFQEGDEGPGGNKNKMDLVFKKAIGEAAEAHAFKSVFKKTMGESMKMSDKPPPYIRLKVNKPVGNVKQFDGNVSNTTPCNCDPNSTNPCGPDGYCINRLLMTECDPEVCPAKDKCQNQRFEKREYPPLTPYRTEGRGWGLKTLAPIKKGTFVIEYVGEVIDDQEYQRRIAKMQEQKDNNYYFLTIENNRMIDAGPKGNFARFMNHCCEPNCETQKWNVKGETRVGLFASKDVEANSEVTFNYNLVSAGEEKKVCMCGAQSCSGFIGVKVKNINEEKKLKKPLGKLTKKKRSPTPVAAVVNMEPCFLCGGDGETFPCHNKICTKYYHLKCVNLEVKPDGKWSCPWHNCNICSKRTIRCCVKCANSYCPVHSEGNVRHDKLLGFICTDHDPSKEPQEIQSSIKKSRKPATLTEESDVTSTTPEEIEDLGEDSKPHEESFYPSESETVRERKKRGRPRKHPRVSAEPQKNPTVVPSISPPEVILTSSVPERHLRTNRKVSSEDSENEKLLKRQQAYEKALPMRKRTTPRTESTEN